MNNKPRRQWLAALLTILETGLGHIYAGKLKRGMILFCINQLLILLFIVSVLVVEPNTAQMIIAALVLIVFAVYCIVDAVLMARRNRLKYQRKKYNRWFVYVGFLVVAWLFLQACTNFIVVPYLIQAFKMPTGSMEPTLLVGDHILIDKHIYRSNEPERGDIIIFQYPPDPKVAYVKRLIGLPGDTVEIIGRTVYINGAALKEKYAQFLDPSSVFDRYGPLRVPPHQYFVLGDNRDNSQDSRFWGCIPRENLLGKPLIIYWSFEIGRDGYLPKGVSERLRRAADNLLHFFSKTRWHRIFQAVDGHKESESI